MYDLVAQLRVYNNSFEISIVLKFTSGLIMHGQAQAAISINGYFNVIEFEYFIYQYDEAIPPHM